MRARFSAVEGAHCLSVRALLCTDRLARPRVLELAGSRISLLFITFSCFRVLIMAGSPNTDLADLLNEMLSGAFRAGATSKAWRFFWDEPSWSARSSANAPSGAYASGSTTHTTRLQHRVDLFPTFWGEPVSAFHGRVGYSANMWLHHFESLRTEDQPPEIRNRAFWVQKFPLNDSGGVALSDLVGDLESVQVLRFISGADPDPRNASASASSASPANPPSTVDASTDAFPEPVQTMVWRCRGLCVDCKKACCGKSDEDYDKVKWHKNHRCNYCWTVWKAERR